MQRARLCFVCRRFIALQVRLDGHCMRSRSMQCVCGQAAPPILFRLSCSGKLASSKSRFQPQRKQILHHTLCRPSHWQTMEDAGATEPIYPSCLLRHACYLPISLSKSPLDRQASRNCRPLHVASFSAPANQAIVVQYPFWSSFYLGFAHQE